MSTEPATIPPEAKAALDEIQRLNASLALARRRYFDALADDDPVAQVAFRLYQRNVLAEEDWPEDQPVTWEDWWTLQIQSERDEYLALAADLIAFVREQDSGSTCPRCEGTGGVRGNSGHDSWVCQDCNGTGVVPTDTNGSGSETR